MFIPLVQMLVDDHKYPVITEENHDEWTAAQDYSMLFFGGDGKRLDETPDVAVVVPMLEQHFKGKFKPAVVALEAERQLQVKYRFNAFPALVFLKGEKYLGTITRMQDWTDYVVMVEEVLGKEPTDPPSFKLPHGCGTDEASEAVH